jgi:hypothetical protein
LVPLQKPVGQQITSITEPKDIIVKRLYDVRIAKAAALRIPRR